MPDTPIETGSQGGYPAVLEQIARDTRSSLDKIEQRLGSLQTESQANFRWMIGIMLGGFVSILGGFAGLLGVMAHGFHWH